MKKPKKTRKDLARIETFLTKEKERLDRFEEKRHARQSVSPSIVLGFFQRMAERQALLLADLEAVRSEIAKIETFLAAPAEAVAPARDVAPAKRPAPKASKKPARPAVPAAAAPVAQKVAKVQRAPRTKRPASA
jgi:ribosomal protein L29